MTRSPFLFLLFIGLALSLFGAIPGQSAFAKQEHWTCHDPIHDDLEALHQIIEDFSDDDASPSTEPPLPELPDSPPIHLTHRFSAAAGAATVSKDDIAYTATFSVQNTLRIWSFGPARNLYFLITPRGRGAFYDFTGLNRNRHGRKPTLQSVKPTHNYTCTKDRS